MERFPSTEYKFKAIAWAAEKNNMSYGQFVESHNSDEIEEVYKKYETILKERKNAKSKNN